MYKELPGRTSHAINQQQNFLAFRRFRDGIRFPEKFGTGDVLIKAKLICYGLSKIFVYNGSVILMDHGAVGVSGELSENGGQTFAVLINSGDAIYSPGRSLGILTIEHHNPTEMNSFVRIEIEERFNDYILWNN